jgi:hypothetical protein
MSSHIRFQKAASFAIIVLLLCLITNTVGSSTGQTTLKIEKIYGALGKVYITVKNIGNDTALNLSTTIHITGGILHKINITQICDDNCGCNQAISPNATETRHADIFAFGPIDITVSTQATNALKITDTATGFVIGPLVIIKK